MRSYFTQHITVGAPFQDVPPRVLTEMFKSIKGVVNSTETSAWDLCNIIW
jgi:hypothetical protein